MLPEIAIKKNLAVNGRSYPVIEAGEGPLVVCLHGFPYQPRPAAYDLKKLRGKSLVEKIGSSHRYQATRTRLQKDIVFPVTGPGPGDP